MQSEKDSGQTYFKDNDIKFVRSFQTKNVDEQINDNPKKKMNKLTITPNQQILKQ